MTEKKVKGKNLHGEDREYIFKLVDAKTGTRIFHQYISILLQLVPEEFSSSEDSAEPKEINWYSLVSRIEEHLPYERLEELAAVFVSGAVIEIDGKKYTADKDGFGDYALGDPLEIYTAIGYGIKANYPKYIDPLFEAPEGI